MIWYDVIMILSCTRVAQGSHTLKVHAWCGGEMHRFHLNVKTRTITLQCVHQPASQPASHLVAVNNC